MTSQMFASLDLLIFAGVVAKRQERAAATRRVDALIEACPCDRSCRCALQEQIKEAKLAEGQAYMEMCEAEDRYLSYLEVKRS